MPRILVVDDEADVRRVLQLHLEHAGYEVDTVADGIQAVSVFGEAAYDLVITDIVMPGKEGIETISDLLRLAPGLPIVAISGGGRIGAHDYLAWVRCCGVQHTFAKPIDLGELLEVVEQLVGAPAA